MKIHTETELLQGILNKVTVHATTETPRLCMLMDYVVTIVEDQWLGLSVNVTKEFTSPCRHYVYLLKAIEGREV